MIGLWLRCRQPGPSGQTALNPHAGGALEQLSWLGHALDWLDQVNAEIDAHRRR